MGNDQDGLKAGVFERLGFALLLTFILFGSVTWRVRFAYVDGPPLNFYGFPWPWYRFSGVSSLEYVVDPLYLLLDFGVYFLMMLALVWIRPVSALLHRYRGRAVVLLAVLAVVPLVSLFAQLFVFGRHYARLALPEAGEVIERALHLGFNFPY